MVSLRKDSETRRRAAIAAVKRWRNLAHATVSVAALLLFHRDVLFQPIEWVGNDGMNRTRFALVKPRKAIPEM